MTYTYGSDKGRKSPLTEGELVVLAYLLEHKVGTASKISEYTGMDVQVIRNIFGRLRRMSLISCHRRYVLETILDEETFEEIMKKLGTYSKREVICYANIDRKEAEERYFRPLNLSIDKVLEWRGIRPINYESLERLKRELKEK